MASALAADAHGGVGCVPGSEDRTCHAYPNRDRRKATPLGSTQPPRHRNEAPVQGSPPRRKSQWMFLPALPTHRSSLSNLVPLPMKVDTKRVSKKLLVHLLQLSPPPLDLERRPEALHRQAKVTSAATGPARSSLSNLVPLPMKVDTKRVSKKL